MTLASQIPLINNACNEILNAGATIRVKLLNDCEKEAQIDTLTVDSVTAVDDETISLTSSNTTPGTFLQANSVLTFPSGTVVVAEDTLVTTATTVPTQPQTAIIAAADTTENQGLLKLLSPTNIPLARESTTVSRVDLSSIQGSMVKTLLSYNPQITCIASADDRALWEAIFPSANSIRDVYAVVQYNSTQVAFGRALISNYSADGATEEIMRPQFNLEFQGEDYRLTTAWQYETTENQAIVNTALTRAGIAPYA